MLSLQRLRGLSLIETMITLGIAALVLTLGVPAFGNWVRNAQVRSSAEALRAALQFARAQAVQRNAVVRLTLTDAGGRASWRIACVRVSASCPALLQAQSADAANTARLGASTSSGSATATALSNALGAGNGLPAAISFTATGTVLAGSMNFITRIDITDAVSQSARRLSILIGSAGMIRLCDPLATGANNPQGCS